MENRLQLYVWKPYAVPYGSSLLFVVASSIEEAKEQASRAAGYYSYGDNFFESDMKALANELGEPLRILPLPCAEWHEWGE